MHEHTETRYNGQDFDAECSCGRQFTGRTPDDAESVLLQHLDADTPKAAREYDGNGEFTDVDQEDDEPAEYKPRLAARLKEPAPWLAPVPLTFTLTIELGNEGMQNGEDVAEALRATADNVGTIPSHWPFDSATVSLRDTVIRDVNGNTVGSWGVK